MMQNLFGAGDRNPFMPAAFKTMPQLWMSPTAGMDVALFWMNQWSKMASLENSPMSVFARAWSVNTKPLVAPPADTPADIAFGSSTDAMPAINNPPVDAAAVLGLKPKRATSKPAAPKQDVIVSQAVVDTFATPVAAPVDVEAATVAVSVAEVEPAADELTRIVGIGPRLAAGLASEGITRFAQIAKWNAEDLEKFDKVLALKGRAVRDAWVAQAKRFADAATN